MIKPGRNKLFLTSSFFAYGSALVLLFAFGFSIPVLFTVAKLGLACLICCSIADGIILFLPTNKFSARRVIANKIGLSDKTLVKLFIEVETNFSLSGLILEELPFQLQSRGFRIASILINGTNPFVYSVLPLNRGIYQFGNTNLMINSKLNLIRRRIVLDTAKNIAVYPSIKQMHEQELLAFSRMNSPAGFRKFNKIGKSYEFEQISLFNEGDDYRNINWKASSKRNELMVNKYQDERSQNFYCIVSKGRAMKMAFNQMSLLDYSINSSLALLNVVLKKYDKAGLITFSDKIGTAIRAENRMGQIQKILESLYKEQERGVEPSYELLFQAINRIIKTRSLLMLFANFENLDMALRAMPYLKRIAKKHLLVMILFQDTELEARANEEGKSIESIYQVTLAKKHLHEKDEIAHIFRKQGIHTLVSKPEDLSSSAIEKYLELKSQGII